jgi:membrane protease YdiL (CAAX protease family)
MAFGFYGVFVRLVESRNASELLPHFRPQMVPLCFAVALLQLAHLFWGISLAGYDLFSLRLFFTADDGELRLILLLLLSSLFVAPVLEEIVFRGIFLRYAWSRMNAGLALVSQALAFAMIHSFMSSDEPLTRFLQLFMSGIFLGLVFAQTGNLLLAMLMHSLLNLTSLVGGFFVPTDSFGDQEAMSTYIATVSKSVRGLEIWGIGLLCLAMSYRGMIGLRPRLSFRE